LVEALRVEAVRAAELFAHFFRSKIFFKLAQTDRANVLFSSFFVVIGLLGILAMSFLNLFLFAGRQFHQEVPSPRVVALPGTLCEGGRFAVRHFDEIFDYGFSFTDSACCLGNRWKPLHRS
jgi:hypothetical protein